ncbi:MAG: GAF domain-containing protein [Geothrix sp.]|uniref:GAF domain-containing protein n=1 Tax=Candidatus Geothrix odensensis TaxID=2954440 RepID=A0A936K574_9BACT|nr:GAF domain-containing protein [Holophagaceae bacterium]MBK8571384.1 GAF domain-containing protein [Candidatus Geothrix odensensis]MBK8790028.1 GAF domain-containing protein [Holophagaceae bacterium]MCC6514305.1 GAF domain-containing protein [Geothrix sp.]
MPSQTQPDSDPIFDLFEEAESVDVEALSQEVQHLREKENFLHRLLMAMTLLSRHRSIVSGDLRSALRDITRMAALSVQVQRASVWFLDDTRTNLACACIFDGLEGLHSEGARLSAANYPTYFAEIERGRVVAADDARHDPRTREFTEGYLIPLSITSMLDVPIKHGDKLAGVVCLEHTGSARTWLPEEKQFAAFASSLVSLAMEASDRIGQLEKGRAQ